MMFAVDTDSQPGQQEMAPELIENIVYEVLSKAEVLAMPQDDDPRVIGQRHLISPDPTSTAHFDGRRFGGALARMPKGLTEATFVHCETGSPNDMSEEAYVGWIGVTGERWVARVGYDPEGACTMEVSHQEPGNPVRIHRNDWMAHMGLLYARVLAERIERGA